MKKYLSILPLLCSGFFFGQSKSDSIQLKKISDEILTHGQAYEDLWTLCKHIGNRLSGSDNYEKSIVWAVDKLKEAGADQVWVQPVMVPVWKRGKESLQIKTETGRWININMLSLGNSEGTKGKDLTGEIILVKTIDDFNKLTPEQVKDKIVFFNYAFRQDFVDTSNAYGDAGIYRYSTASMVSKKGGKGVIIRSLTSAFDDVPHTGMMHYEDNTEKIPALAIGAKSADELENSLKKQKVFAKINSDCGMQGEKQSYNVIGEIKGKKDQSVIVVGGHLDSWDVGEGASDDGTGIVQSIEVLRTFKKMKLNNNHTIRVICFANEENGVKGGNTYADEVQNTQEKHIMAMESDEGGFLPRSINLDMAADKIKMAEKWLPLFAPYGIYTFEHRYSGTDIRPLAKLNVPLTSMQPDTQRYFDIHHTSEDTFEKVNRRELLLGAVVMSQFIYLVDKNW